MLVKGPVARARYAGLPAVLAFDDPALRQAAVQPHLIWSGHRRCQHPKAIVDYYADVE